MKKINLVLAISLFIATPLSAWWWRVFPDERGGGHGNYVVQTDDGGFIIAGHLDVQAEPIDTHYVWVIKTDQEGILEWSLIYQGSEMFERARSVIELDDGYMVLCEADNESVLAYMALMKVDKQGNILWTKIHDEPLRARGNAFVRTDDGGFMITGSEFTIDPESNENIIVVKTDSLGNKLWSKSYGRNEYFTYEQGYHILKTSDGNYIVSGDSMWNGWIMKIDNSGNQIWDRSYFGATDDEAVVFSADECSNGGYVFSGFREDGWGFLLRTDSEGDSLWSKSYAFSCVRGCRNVQETCNGGFIVTTESDATLIKTDSLGELNWIREYGGRGYCVRETSDSGFVVTGQGGPVGSRSGIWFLKTDSTGIIPQGVSPVWFEMEQTGDDPQLFSPSAMYVNHGLALATGFYCHCRIVPSNYHDSILITDTLSIWEKRSVEFESWMPSQPDNYSVTFFTTDAGECSPMSYGFHSIGIGELKQTSLKSLEIVSSVGSEIKLHYENYTQGLHFVIFDALGRKVDEVRARNLNVGARLQPGGLLRRGTVRQLLRSQSGIGKVILHRLESLCYTFVITGTGAL